MYTVISMCSLLIIGHRKPTGKLYLYKAYCTINYHFQKILFYEWWISAFIIQCLQCPECYHISDNVPWLSRQLVSVGGVAKHVRGCGEKACVAGHFSPLPCISCGPGRSVGIANDYGLDGPGSNPGGDEIFHLSRPALGATLPPVKWVPSLSRGWSAAGVCCWPPTPF